jgi:pyruvate,water dikinase
VVSKRAEQLMSTAVGDFPIPDDLEGQWGRDQVHCPRPLSPLTSEVLLPALGEGFSAAMVDLAYPARFGMRAVNSYGYSGFLRTEAVENTLNEHRARLAALLPRIGDLWQQEWLPSILPGIERTKRTDYAALTDAELMQTFAELRRELVRRWHVHGRILFVYVAASAFDDFYREAFAPADPNEAYLLLAGFPTRAADSNRGLWRLSRAVLVEPALTALFQSTPARELPARLEASAEGRRFLGELRAYLEEFGWRSDTIAEIAEPTWREDPTPPMTAIQGYLALGDDAGPDARLQRAAARRQELAARARARLADQPAALAHFEALYEPARHYLVIDEDHNFYIDQTGNAVMRLPVLEMGRRLAERGLMAARDDVFTLTVAEIGEGLAGRDLHAAVTARRTELAHWATVTPPLEIGTPGEGGGEMDPFLLAMLKQDGAPPAASEATLIRGLPGAPGVARGRARVARSLEEAGELEPGDVLVCEMTLPTWTPLFSLISAVVADTGGTLSHCAIVAREFGIPCVVGTQRGTALIPDGALVTVDGAAGTVQIEG